KSKIYGATNPALTASLSGFVNGDTAAVVSGSPTLATTATSASSVGNFAITLSQGNLSSANYTFAFQTGMLAITPATLTVAADAKAKVYGAAIPTLTATLTGFVNGDTTAVIGGSPGLSTSTTTASGVGSYSISATLGSLSAFNYTFVFQPGALTVSAATLTVT